MPEPLAALLPATALSRAAIGFCGKLPARGDFVATGLPRRFVEPWHDWMQRMLAASREALGDRWLDAWLEAPVWRFALAGGVCGPDAALGLWMPSVDRVGRHFPLTFAALAADAGPGALIDQGGAFLAAAESAGRDALAYDAAPDEIAARLAAAAAAPESAAPVLPMRPAAGGSAWWSEGSSRVPAAAFACESLPDEARFVLMLDAGAGACRADCGERP